MTYGEQTSLQSHSMGPPNQGAGLQGGKRFRGPFTCAHTVRPRMTKFRMMTNLGKRRVPLGPTMHPQPRGRETSGPIFETHPYARTYASEQPNTA